jgi:uncharacterized protein YjbJ (UPF0337 family)
VFGAFGDPSRRVRQEPEEAIVMSDNPKVDEAKGRVKEAVGDLADDPKLKREGKMDRAGGKVKEKTDEAVDRAKEKVNEVANDDRDS